MKITTRYNKSFAAQHINLSKREASQYFLLQLFSLSSQAFWILLWSDQQQRVSNHLFQSQNERRVFMMTEDCVSSLWNFNDFNEERF